MSIEVTVPALGESIVEATVGRWLKTVGDSVAEGEPLVELETDKVNMEVAADAAGVLQSIVKAEGEIVNIGDVVATIDESATAGNGAGATPEAGAAAGTTPAAATAAPAPEEPTPAAQPAAPAPVAQAAPAETESNGDGDGARSTPLARRIAGEHGIDISRIQGTGPSGRVTREDVTAYLAQQGPLTPQPPSPSRGEGERNGGTEAAAIRGRGEAGLSAQQAPAASSPVAQPSVAGNRVEERIRMSRRRQTIARRLVEAQQSAAMLTTFNEVDMSAIMDIRKKKRDEFKERYGVGLGYMSFFTKAVVSALKAFPRLNAEIQGDEMILKYYYDIGIAVSTDEGLVVPVLRDADRLTFAEIERGIAGLASRARDGQLTLAELQGGTFTLTNGGIFGSLLSTPILNTPQVGILGMHKIQERAIAVNGQVVVRPMMYLAVSYDHRIVDGAESVRFLVHVKERLEDPVSLLLEG